MNIRNSSVFRLIRRELSKRPFTYYPLAKALGNTQLLQPNTSLVIDGFPRSANSFIEAALRVSQPGIHLATHSHAAAQIIRAVHLKIPTLVLIRNPDNAVASFLEMLPPSTHAANLYRDYISFYNPIKNIDAYILHVSFEQATRKLPCVVQQLNEKFNLSLIVPEMTPEFLKRVSKERDRISTERVGRVPRYSTANDSSFQKERLSRRQQCQEQVKEFEKHPLRLSAMDIYHRFLKYSA